MRVLLVNDDAPGFGGGISVHLLRLARGLEAAGDVVEFFAGAVQHRGWRRALDLWDPGARAELSRRTSAFGAEVIHFHNVLTELSPAVYGAQSTAARVLTVHNFHLTGEPYGPVGAPSDPLVPRVAKAAQARLARGIALRRMHAVMAPGGAIADALKRVGFTNVRVVPNFVDAGADPATPPSSSVDVLFVGRLGREKGIYELIEAFARSAAKHAAARLVVVGEGEESASLRSLAARTAPGRVEFTSALDEAGVRALMDRSRLVAMPSTTRETSGIVAIEAASAGRPLVISDDPGLREFADAAGCAIVVPRGDVAALSTAIDALLSDPAMADRMGAAGRNAVLATRTTDVVIATIREVYSAAIRSARA